VSAVGDGPAPVSIANGVEGGGMAAGSALEIGVHDRVRG
jgi:hypothetical protein